MKLFILLFITLCAGCTSMRKEVRELHRIDVVTVPPGGYIEFEGDYLGRSPVTIFVETQNDGSWLRRGENDACRVFVATRADGGGSVRKSYLTRKTPPGSIILFTPELKN